MKTLLMIIAGLFSTQTAIAQHAELTNVPSKTTTRQPIAEGPEVWGVFHGRVPCQQMAGVLNLPVEAGCETLKWGFTFYKNPKTGEPTTYEWAGSLYRDKARTGQWTTARGTANDRDATVIVLDPDQPGKSLMFLKGDDNVLFILDNSRELMVGGDYLGYTFNRVVN